MIMNVNIQTVHFNADSKLIGFVNRKLEKLSNFNDVIHAVKDKIAEIRVHVAGHNFFVKSTSKSFEESFDNALESMIIQIKKNKEKKAA